jgi:hypothetical protein
LYEEPSARGLLDDGATTLSKTILSIMTLSITTLSIMTPSKMTLSKMTLSLMTLSKTTVNLRTFSLMTLSITKNTLYIYCHNTRVVYTVSLFLGYGYAKCPYAKCFA